MGAYLAISVSSTLGPWTPLGVHAPAATHLPYSIAVTSVRSRSNACEIVTWCAGRSVLPPVSLPIMNLPAGTRTIPRGGPSTLAGSGSFVGTDAGGGGGGGGSFDETRNAAASAPPSATSAPT